MKRRQDSFFVLMGFIAVAGAVGVGMVLSAGIDLGTNRRREQFMEIYFAETQEYQAARSASGGLEDSEDRDAQEDLAGQDLPVHSEIEDDTDDSPR